MKTLQNIIIKVLAANKKPRHITEVYPYVVRRGYMNKNLYRDLHGSAAILALPLLYIGEESNEKYVKKYTTI